MSNDFSVLDLSKLGSGEWKRISKEEAFDLLTQLNQTNRPIRNDWVRRLKELMNSGEFNWQNPDPICISKEDLARRAKKLLNGQHRLTALVDSDLDEGVFFIMDDVDESVYDTLDQGQKRNAADFYCRMLGTRKDDVLEDGTSAIKHNKHVVRIAFCMERMRCGDSMPSKYRFQPAEQANLARRYKRIVEAILEHYKVSKNLAYATPVAAAFANAALRYGLLNILPLLQAYTQERWRDVGDKVDPLKRLHQMIRDYNAKDKQAKKRINTQRVMYGYAMSAISSALCSPEHWVERLAAPKKARNFGDNPVRETQIRRNITVSPEPEYTQDT